MLLSASHSCSHAWTNIISPVNYPTGDTLVPEVPTSELAKKVKPERNWSLTFFKTTFESGKPWEINSLCCFLAALICVSFRSTFAANGFGKGDLLRSSNYSIGTHNTPLQKKYIWQTWKKNIIFEGNFSCLKISALLRTFRNRIITFGFCWCTLI